MRPDPGKLSLSMTLLVALVATSCGRIGFDAANGPTPGDSGGPGDTGGPNDTMTTVCSGPRLVAHWRLDETSGTSIVDSAGSNDGVWTDTNDGTVTNEAMTGRSAGALFFGAGSWVHVAGFVVPSEGTFSAWLTSGFNEGVAFSGFHPILIDTPTPRTTISFDSDMRVYGVRTNDVSWQASYAPPEDFTGWFHLTGTWSASGAQLYIDGVPVGTPAVSDARSASPAGLYLGTRESQDRLWNGLVDDVRFYDYALESAEVAELYGCP